MTDCNDFELLSPDDVDQIDWSNPISDDPLNDGLAELWLPGQGVPGGWGGDKLIGLRRLHTGTLTNGPTWSADMPPGGWGSLQFTAASSQYVSVPTPSALNGTTDFTVAIVFKSDSLSQQRLYQQRNGGVQGEFWVEVQPFTGQLEVNFSIYNNGFQFELYSSSAHRFDAGEWVYVVCRRYGATGEIWQNGKLCNSTTGTLKALDSGLDSAIGGDIRDENKYLDGSVASAIVWDAKKDPVAIYHELRTGLPHILNREPLGRHNVQAAGGAATVGCLINGGLVNSGLVNGGLIA